MDMRILSKRDICTKFITPAVCRAGWDRLLQIRALAEQRAIGEDHSGAAAGFQEADDEGEKQVGGFARAEMLREVGLDAILLAAAERRVGQDDVDALLLLPGFAHHAVASDLVVDQIVDITKGGAHQKISLKRFRGIQFPLPPLAEQHRIVAKVDALMALCDRLEAALSTADTTRQRLLEALLHEALAAAAELEAAE